MFALEIINALNDPDNSAKPKGLNARLKGHLVSPKGLSSKLTRVVAPAILEEVPTQDELKR